MEGTGGFVRGSLVCLTNQTLTHTQSSNWEWSVSSKTDIHAHRDRLAFEIEPDQRRYVHFSPEGLPIPRPMTSGSAYYSGGGRDVDEQTRELLLAAQFPDCDVVIPVDRASESLPADVLDHLEILFPEHALPIVGLCMRAQGRFVLGMLFRFYAADGVQVGTCESNRLVIEPEVNHQANCAFPLLLDTHGLQPVTVAPEAAPR